MSSHVPPLPERREISPDDLPETGPATPKTPVGAEKVGRAGLGVLLTTPPPSHLAIHSAEMYRPLGSLVTEDLVQASDREKLQIEAALTLPDLIQSSGMDHPIIRAIAEQIFLRRNDNITKFVTPGMVGGKPCFIDNNLLFIKLINPPTTTDPTTFVSQLMRSQKFSAEQTLRCQAAIEKHISTHAQTPGQMPSAIVLPLMPESPQQTPPQPLVMNAPQLRALHTQMIEVQSQLNKHLKAFAQANGIALNDKPAEKSELSRDPDHPQKTPSSPVPQGRSSKNTPEVTKRTKTADLTPQGKATSSSSKSMLETQKERIEQENSFQEHQKAEHEKSKEIRHKEEIKTENKEHRM